MGFSLVPQYAFRRYTDVAPGFLNRLGVRFLMLDLDNTIAKYSEHSPSEVAIEWITCMKSKDIELFFISNSKRETRVDSFSEALGVDFVKNAGKPSPDGLMSAMAAKGYHSGESALLGDQVFTDMLAGNRAGVTSIIVRPLSLKNPLLFLRFAAEAPFRAICPNKKRNGFACE